MLGTLGASDGYGGTIGAARVLGLGQAAMGVGCVALASQRPVDYRVACFDGGVEPRYAPGRARHQPGPGRRRLTWHEIQLALRVVAWDDWRVIGLCSDRPNPAVRDFLTQHLLSATTNLTRPKGLMMFEFE